MTAYLLFNINEWATYIALLVWAYQVDGVSGSGVVAVAQLVPAALLASVIAARLGRMPTYHSIRLGYAVQTVTAGIVGVAMLVDAPFALVCLLAAVNTLAIALTRPVHHALLPEISDTTGELTAGNAGSGSMEAFGILLGPLVSGALTAWWDAGGVGIAMSLASALALVSATGLGSRTAVPRSDRDDRTSTARAVLRDPVARLLSGLVGAEYAMLGMLDILLVVLALDLLDMSDAGPGLLNSAIGIGGIAGAALTVVLIGVRRLTPAVLAGALLAGIAVALAGLATSPAVAVVLVAVAGIGKVFFDVTLRTLVQRLLPDRLLTAVFGLQESLMMGGIALGSAVAPLLVTGPGPRTAYLVAGALLPALSLLSWWRLRVLDTMTVVPEDVLALLHEVAILEPLAPRVLDRLALFSRRGSFAAGEAVVREGEIGDTFYVLVSGRVAVSHGAAEIRRLGPGDWFGELALLHADARRTATVTTIEAVEAVMIDRQTFLTALASAPKSRSIADDHARDHYL
jgi:MFS family permease